MLERGKHHVVGVVFGESAGKTIEEVKKKEVVITPDGGIEDIEYMRDDTDEYPYVQCDCYGSEQREVYRLRLAGRNWLQSEEYRNHGLVYVCE
jgi:hypothetical protein